MAKVVESQAPQVEGKEMRLQEALREALRYEMARSVPFLLPCGSPTE